MKTASEPPALPPSFSGPTAAILVALVGAALVAVGLVLVGVRETKVGQWTPAPVFMPVEAA